MLSEIKRWIFDSELVWKYITNSKARRLYRDHQVEMPQIQQRLLRDLNRDGFAIANVVDLFSDLVIFKELDAYVRQVEEMQQVEIKGAREHADAFSAKKDFLVQLLGDKPTLDLKDINVRFALQGEILNVVNSYFGCLTRLKFYNIWHTFVTNSGPKRSMLWHKDPEDKWIIKVFLYLNDVDEGGGPFVYAPGTHPKGTIKKKPEWFKEPERGAERSTDAQMEKVIDSTRWIKAIGKKGTIIFADTRGYHKGGFATANERIMYNCLFVSDASKAPEVFVRKELNVDSVAFSVPQRFALNI